MASEKIICYTCKGEGTVFEHHFGDKPCPTCDGDGKLLKLEVTLHAPLSRKTELANLSSLIKREGVTLKKRK